MSRGDEVDIQFGHRRGTLALIAVFRIVNGDLESDLRLQSYGVPGCSIGAGMLAGQQGP